MIYLILLGLLFGFFGVPLIGWIVLLGLFFWYWQFPLVLGIILLAPLAVLALPGLRASLVTKALMNFLKAKNLLPSISATEKVAIEAGSTWIDKELFSGKPNFGRILNEPYSALTSEEQEFLDEKCAKLCEMSNDWEIFQNRDLPPEIWDFLKKEKFFGLAIPREYGGLGFSALCHSEVISYLTTRSIPVAITTMVPNSLGPAELLLHYGTDEQKSEYLPKLACGDEIPCFGLTEVGAGSDAGSIASTAEVFTGDDGEAYLRLNWSKRYITLGAVSTLLGLAVKVRDPKNILGKGEEPGITCVLVPATAQGVRLGRRHDPLGVPFYNCPIDGEDVVVSVNQIIGGPDRVGDGWFMLMESLAAGRSISLPSQASGSSKLSARVAGAYADIRYQFGMPIGKFEGITAELAEIGASAYMLDASRVFTSGAVDIGIKPAVVSAIAKQRCTEEGRAVITRAMDVLGGAGISLGPRNLLGHTWWSTPISITVEGANILTRTMIIFGQGAIRCHPYAYQELSSLEKQDLSGFDKAFWGHVGHVIQNLCRSSLLYLTRGRLAMTPSGPMRRYYRKLSWASASFALNADIAMGAFGGSLKFKESLTGRFADIFSSLYLASCILRRFEAEGRRVDHMPFAEYALDRIFRDMQRSFDELYQNLELPVVGRGYGMVVGFLSRLNPFGQGPSDKTGTKVAKSLMTPGETRDDVTLRAFYLPTSHSESLGFLENAFALHAESKLIFAKIRGAQKEGTLGRGKPLAMVDEAVSKSVITEEERETVKQAQLAIQGAVKVDEFAVEDFAANPRVIS